MHLLQGVSMMEKSTKFDLSVEIMLFCVNPAITHLISIAPVLNTSQAHVGLNQSLRRADRLGHGR